VYQQLIVLLHAQVILSTEEFFDRPCGNVARSDRDCSCNSFGG
jgi:hypothetical protein